MNYDQYLVKEEEPEDNYDKYLVPKKETKKKHTPTIKQPTDEDLKLTTLEKVAQSAPVKFLGDLGAGTMGALAGAMRGADWLGKTVAMQPQMPPEIEKQRTNIADILASKLAEQGEKSSEMGFEEGSIPKYVSQGIGGAAVSVPLMAAGGIVPYSMATAGGQAKAGGKSQPEQLGESLIGGAAGFVIDKILHGIGKKELSLIPRQLLGGTAMASVPLVEETARKIIAGEDPSKIDWKQKTAEFIQGALFPIGGKKKNKPKLAPQAPTIEPKVPPTKDTQGGKIVEPGATSRGIEAPRPQFKGDIKPEITATYPKEQTIEEIKATVSDPKQGIIAYRNGEEYSVALRNPLVVEGAESRSLKEQYGTVGAGAENKAGAEKLTSDMKAMGHDGIIRVDRDTEGNIRQMELVKFEADPAHEGITDAGDFGTGLYYSTNRGISDAYAKKLGKQDAAKQGEGGMPQAGMVRLYRGQRENAGYGPVTDTSDKGRWFTTDKETAKKFGGEQLYVDVPESAYKKMVADGLELDRLGGGFDKRNSGAVMLDAATANKAIKDMTAPKPEHPKPPTMNNLPTPEAGKPSEIVPPPVAEPGQGIRQTVTNSLTKELGLRVDDYVGKEKFYDKETLPEWWDVAANKIKVGGENQSLTRLLNTEQFDKYDVTEGRILLRYLREQGGRESDITALAQKMATQGTEMARGLASWRNFDVLQNPEMIAAKIFNEAKKHLGNKAPKLTPEQVKNLGDMARDANKLQGRQRVIAEAKMYAYIRNQVPKSIWKKISTVQAIHQLLNAKTVIRNIVGNTGLEVMEIVSHYAGMPGDYLLSRFTGNRSVTVPRTIKHIGDLARTFKTSIVDIKDGINTSKSSIEQQTGMKIAGELENMFEFNAGETFKGNTFYGKLEKLVGYTMQAPDRAFFEARFWDSVDNMMRATKTKAITPEIMTQALQEASNVTFRDMNNISKGLVALKKGLNKFTAGTMHGEFGFGDLALKYPKVPGAIIKRGIEYSPFGLLGSVLKPFKLAYKGIKGQDVSAIEQRQAVLASARGVVGTVLAGLGYALAKSDDVTGKRPDNPKLAAFEDAIGKRPYSFKKKNSIISYDWLQPAAMPFTMGVDLATKKELEQKGDGVFQQIVNFITDTGAAAGSSIAEQPVMTGISRLASGEKYGNEGGIMGGLLSSAAAAPSSFVPTLFAQVASTIDPVKKVIPKNFSGRMLALFVNRIPVLSKTLDTRKSVLGEDMKKGVGNAVTDLILNLISPTIYGKLKDDPNVNLISQLYADTKDTDVLPVTPGASKTGIITYKNQIYELTQKQKLELQESTAKLALDRLTLIGRGININKMSLESKVKFMKKIYNYAGEVARKKMIANVISEKIKKGKK